MFFQKITDNIAKDSVKRKRDYEAVKERMIAIHNINRSQEDLTAMLVDLKLYNGDLDPKMYKNKVCFEYDDPLTGEVEQLNYDDKDLVHTGLIANFIQPITGEYARWDLDPQIEDLRKGKFDDYRTELEQPIQQFVTQISQQHVQTILQNTLNTEGKSVDEIASIAQNQAAIQQQAVAAAEAALPPSLRAFARGQYTSPIVQQACELLNYLVKTFDIKRKTTQGLKYALAHDQVYFYAGDWNGDLTFRVENPMNIVWAPSDKSEEDIRHAEWVKRSNYISLTHAKSRHRLTPSIIKELEGEDGMIGKYGSTTPIWGDNKRTRDLIYRYADMDEHFKAKYSDVNVNTTEGDAKFLQMYSQLYNSNHNMPHTDCSILEEHILVRLPIVLTEVERWDPEIEQYRKYEFGEHYTKVAGDRNVREIRGDAIYEAWLLDGRIFTGLRLVKCQYEREGEFHKALMPYIGRAFSTHQGTTRSRSRISRARGANKMYDIVLASIKSDIRSDWGSVFMMTMNARPKDMKPDVWLNLIRYYGLLYVDPSQSTTMRNIEPQYFRQLDMSRMNRMAEKLNMLNQFKSLVAFNLFVSEARAEGLGQYANAELVEQQQQVMYNKTGEFEETFRTIVEDALGAFLEIARHDFSRNLHKAKEIFDQVQIALFDVMGDNFYKLFGVKVTNNEEKRKKLQFIVQSLLQPSLQNGMNIESAFQMVYAETKEEAWDILKEDAQRQAQQAQQRAAQAQSLQQEKLQTELASDREERALKEIMQMRDLSSKERRAAIEAQKFLIANDVNANGEHDLVDMTLQKVAADLEKHRDNLDFKKEELEFKKSIDRV